MKNQTAPEVLPGPAGVINICARLAGLLQESPTTLNAYSVALAGKKLLNAWLAAADKEAEK